MYHTTKKTVVIYSEFYSIFGNLIINLKSLFFYEKLNTAGHKSPEFDLFMFLDC